MALPSRQFVSIVLLRLCTWPYYWALEYFTLRPVRELADACNLGIDVAAQIHAFRETKRNELGMARTASTISAVASIGYLQYDFPEIPDTPRFLWVSTAASYTAFMFAVLTVVLSAHFTAIVDSYSDIELNDDMAAPRVKEFLSLVLERNKQRNVATGRLEFAASAKLIYVWQAPFMLAAWSLVLLGGSYGIKLGSAFLLPPGVNDDAKSIATVAFAGTVIAVFNLFYCAGRLYKRALRPSPFRAEII